MRVLIIGSGGREHALAWKLAQSPLLSQLYCAPGNAGISSVARCIDIEAGNQKALLEWASAHHIDLTVIGPEAPLVDGLADRFRKIGIKVFGPGSKAAQLEGSKAWAKEMMLRCAIPTARYAVFDQLEAARRHLEQRAEGPLVVKADGLAAGKGVTVAQSRSEAEAALTRIMAGQLFGEAGRRVIIEDCLEGEELSLLALTDGRELALMPFVQDHKAIGEGDRGANTGGMGAYSPVPQLPQDLAGRVEREVFLPLLSGLRAQSIDYRGVIYAGLMISGNEINLLEFNVRFGDPETQVILPRMASDLLPILLAAAEGRLAGLQPRWKEESAVCVVLSSAGYPGPYETGKLIRGLERLANKENLAVFHAGTAFSDDRIVTAGGRVLGVTAWGPDLKETVSEVYRAAEKVDFEGCYYRRDIARRALSF